MYHGAHRLRRSWWYTAVGPDDRERGETITLDQTVRVRFAPSPTGELHVGSARTALYNYLFARHHEGRLVVRIEDTDAARSETRYERAILVDLAWLGLVWDEGPDCGGDRGPYRQSERGDVYREVAARLLVAGHAYRCFCTEERLERLRTAALEAGRTPRYDRRCRDLTPAEVAGRLASGEAAAVRLAVPDEDVTIDDLIRGPSTFPAGAVGDFIVVRSDGAAGYNFAAAVDDLEMGITHVIRGDDHATNTVRQIAVMAALGASPPRYGHHAMILAADGRKLSKRHGATAVSEFRDLGYLPEALVNYLALLSWSHGGDEVLPLDRLVAEFDLAKLASSPAVFDAGKLDWLDHRWIMASAEGDHARRVAERLPPGTAPEASAALAAACRPSLVRYGDVAEFAAPVLARPDLDDGQRATVAAGAAALATFRSLRAAAPAYLDPDAARELLAGYRAAAAELGLSARDALMPLRLALTGREHGPELHFVVAALERGETLTRLTATGIDSR